MYPECVSDPQPIVRQEILQAVGIQKKGKTFTAVLAQQIMKQQSSTFLSPSTRDYVSYVYAPCRRTSDGARRKAGSVIDLDIPLSSLVCVVKELTVKITTAAD